MKRSSSRRWPLMLALFLLAFLPPVWVFHGLFSRLPLPADGYRLDIPRGASLSSLIDRMADDGVLHNRWLAKGWLKLPPAEKNLRAGTVVIMPPQSTVSLLKMLQQGRVSSDSRLTVIEGITYRDLRRLLAERDSIKGTGIADDRALLQALGAKATSPEGLFAPNTYDIGPGDTDMDVLQRLYAQQQKILEQEWAERAEGLPYASAYEALIMASIVEKETGVGEERARIAGVFVRRLQKGMRLQTDPTVIYGLGPAFDGNLKRADLMRVTPYNTYRVNGLPPTPIALPGRAAIHAALHPAEGTELYFVARGDGSHEFTSTLVEHNQAVRRYQLQKQSDYRSAPES
jgi:UPF0755 protein